MVPAICSGFSAATAARKRAPADASDGVPEDRSVMMVLLGRNGRMRAAHGMQRMRARGDGVILTHRAIARALRIAPPHDCFYVFVLPCLPRQLRSLGHAMNSSLRSLCIALPFALVAVPAFAQPAYPSKPV